VKAEKRIYCVSDGNTDYLVRAYSRSQAIRHVATKKYQSRVATQEDIVRCLQAGVKIEAANESEQPTADNPLESAE
jgi:hypothetical protein